MPGSILKANTSERFTVQENCKAIIITLNDLTATHSCNSFFCRGNNHRFAITKHESTWKLLNALQSKPLDITKANQDHTSCLTQDFTVHVNVAATAEEVVNDVELQLPPLNPRPYMEKQEKAFCLVHSLNVAIGEQIFSGKQVLAHIQKMEDTLVQRKVYNQSLDHFYTKNMGNFNSHILNHFLHHLPCNNGKYYMLRYAPFQEFKEGEITADIINQHLNKAAFKEAVILATSNGT